MSQFNSLFCIINLPNVPLRTTTWWFPSNLYIKIMREIICLVRNFFHLHFINMFNAVHIKKTTIELMVDVISMKPSVIDVQYSIVCKSVQFLYIMHEKLFFIIFKQLVLAFNVFTASIWSYIYTKISTAAQRTIWSEWVQWQRRRRVRFVETYYIIMIKTRAIRLMMGWVQFLMKDVCDLPLRRRAAPQCCFIFD